MRSLAVRTVALMVVSLVITGCNRNSAPVPPQPAPAAAVRAPASPAPAPQPPPIPPGTEVPVASVDSVMLNRAPDAPSALIIDVTGTIPSSGWTNPRLVED